MIWKKWDTSEAIPFPGEYVTYKGDDIFEQRKRAIMCDEKRFKKKPACERILPAKKSE